MKNLSFWNKTLSAKGKMFAGAALAALTALLALVVCSDNSSNPPAPPPGPDCNANPNAAGCPGVPPVGGTDEFFCYWGPDECWKIENPNDPKTDCGTPPGSEACPSGMTNKTGCEAYGKLFESLAACQAYTPAGPDYYCMYETCVKINANAVNPDNAPMTEKEVCEAYGFLTTSPTCADYIKPAVTYYCDWGGDNNCYKLNNPDALKNDCGTPPGSEACPSGMTNKGACEAWATLYTDSDKPAHCK